MGIPFRRGRVRFLLAGSLFVWLVLALATASWLPGFSYLFLWPSLFGVVALWIVLRGHASVRANVMALIFSAAPGCLLFSPAIFLAYHALTIGLLPILAGLTSQMIFLIHVNGPCCPKVQEPRPVH